MNGQVDGKDSIVSTVWTESVLGTETLDVLGSLTYQADAGSSAFEISSWLLRVPGPVKLRLGEEPPDKTAGPEATV